MSGIDELGGPLLDMHNSVDQMMPSGLLGEVLVVAMTGLVAYAAVHSIYEDFVMEGHSAFWR